MILVVVSCIKTVHDERVAADVSATVPSIGALTYVVARVDDAWRIALGQTTPVLST